MFIVQELQTNKEKTALLPALVYETRQEAESAFHQALAAAAISSVEIHAVMLYTEEGAVQRTEVYRHGEAATDE